MRAPDCWKLPNDGQQPKTEGVWPMILETLEGQDIIRLEKRSVTPPKKNKTLSTTQSNHACEGGEFV